MSEATITSVETTVETLENVKDVDGRERGYRFHEAAKKAMALGSGNEIKTLADVARLEHRYLIERIRDGESRSVCIKNRIMPAIALGSDLPCKTDTDVNRIFRAGFAISLLDPDGSSYGKKTLDDGRASFSTKRSHWLKAFSQLVEREGKDTEQEKFVLLPGLEDECHAAFRHCVDKTLQTEDARIFCSKVADKAIVLNHDKTAENLATVSANVKQAETESGLSVKTVKDLRELHKNAATEELKTELADKIKAAVVEQMAKAEALRNAKKELANAKSAASAAKTAFDQLEKRSLPPEKPTGTGDKPEKPAEGPNPVDAAIAMVENATPKDAAEMLVGLIEANKQPNLLVCEIILEIANDEGKTFAKGVREVLKTAAKMLAKLDLTGLDKKNAA